MIRLFVENLKRGQWKYVYNKHYNELIITDRESRNTAVIATESMNLDDMNNN